ncbi:class A beta-lactamase [Paraburkholderia acidisoli]|uniref:beta-lactamase n=1 Tax=Paraburkholderia acidisoli TaxID=2571748 RepID=A0A7Z2GNQ7_9BURK|nr:class A beta-lactamase [Paraburkholderia acidisoli]QGZ65133.1 class A beta-lactamase [Paraburkholderia acidisoli]
MVTRRTFTLTMLGGAIAGVAAQAFGAQRSALEQQLAAIESQAGGRLGVAILDTANGRVEGWRLHERFPMCSTFKVLLASAVLTRKDRGEEDLARKIAYTQAQVVSYSPVSGPRAGSDGMTVAELCEAALTRSDNTAANLLLDSLGGPAAITAFARGLGDPHTRLDRNETTLNEALEHDPRDTTTPAAYIADMRELLLGERLTQASREQLIAWLVANQTGDARLRAGLPKDWRVGDKTGTGDRGTANDVAIVWPPNRAPLLVTAYLTGALHATPAQRDATLAKVGALVAGR